MNTLEDLAERARYLDDLAKQMKEQADQAKAEFKDALVAAGKYDSSTKAVGNVRVKLSSNRFFDAQAAYDSLDEATQEAVLVAKPDPKLVKAHLTPIQLETFMKDYADPFKMSLSVLED